jgi:hypothetical protein
MGSVTRDDFSDGGSYACAMKAVVVSAAVLVAAVGCSGDDEVATSTTTTPATATAAPQRATGSPVATTTTPSTTQPTATSTAPSTAPTTLAPAPSSTEPLAVATTAPLPTDMEGLTNEQIVAIDRDFREGFRLLHAALQNPSDEAATQAAYAYSTDPDRSTTTTEIFDAFLSNNRKLVRIGSVAPSFFIEQGPSLVSGPDHVALLLCEVAPYELVQIGTGPDGTDTLVRGGSVTQRIRIELRFEDGIWKRSAVDVRGQWDGVMRCPEL